MFATAWLAVAGIAAASIPIIIHVLLRRRRKPMPWAAMSLLLQASRQQRRRTRLEQIILLAMRCLIFALAGLALAQPFVNSISSFGRGKTLHLIIDDGVISNLQDEDGRTALERHIDLAIQEVEDLNEGDRVTLTLAARPVDEVISTSTADHRSVKSVLSELVHRDGETDFSAAFERVSTRIQDPTSDHTVYVIGDFRAGTIPIDSQPDPLNTAESSRLQVKASTPNPQSAQNILVESVQVSRNPTSTSTLTNAEMIQVSVQLRRTGDMPSVRSRVQLEGDGVFAVKPRTVEWTPGRSTATVEFQAQTTPKGGVVRAFINPDGLPIDDQYLFMVDPPEPMSVLMIDRAQGVGLTRIDQLGVTAWIERALDPVRASDTLNTPIRIDQTDPGSIDRRDLEGVNIAILARPDLISPDARVHLAEFTKSGGVLVVVPPTDSVVRAWASPLLESMDIPWGVSLEAKVLKEPRALSSQQPESELLELLSSELPTLAPPVRILKRLPVTGYSEGDVVLSDSEGDAVLLESSIGRGRLIFMAIAPVLEWTDLPVRPLMVPLVHEIARQGSALANRSHEGVAGDRPPVVESPSAVAMVDSKGNRISRDASGGFPIPRRRGALKVLDRADVEIETVVVNAANASTDVAVRSREEVEVWLGASGPVVFDDDQTLLSQNQEGDRDLAFTLLVILSALVFLETIASRFFSRSALRRMSDPGITSSGGTDSSAILEPTL